MSPPSPSSRSLAGVAVLLVLIVLLAMVIASLSPIVGKWPVLVQAAFYVLVVVLWTMPLKTLVRWMVTGRFRAPDRGPPD